MNRRSRILLVAAIALMSLSAAGIAALLLFSGRAPLVTASLSNAIGGPFTLAASNGGTVTDRTYRGKWLLVFFGYTHCADACPLALNNIGVALRALGPEAAKLQPLFITIDPKRDTPEVMAKYLKSFDPRIVGLTGTDEETAAVAKEYRIYYSPQQTAAEKDYEVDHSAFIYLMTPEGKFTKALAPDLSGEGMADQVRIFMQRRT